MWKITESGLRDAVHNKSVASKGKKRYNTFSRTSELVLIYLDREKGQLFENQLGNQTGKNEV